MTLRLARLRFAWFLLRRLARFAWAAALVAAPVVSPGAAAAPRASDGRLPDPVVAAIAASGLPGASFGIYAQEVESDRVVLRLNEERPYTMASTTKVVTSLAALDLLGPYFRWRTSAYATGPIVRGRLLGDLLIVGGGNALLTSAELQAWFARMREQGLLEIQGDIVLDRFAFHLSAADHLHTPVQSANQPRHVWPDAMTLDEGLLAVTLEPTRGGRPTLALQPALSDVRLVDRLTMNAGGDCEASPRWQGGGPNGEAEVIVQGRWSTACGKRTFKFVPPADSGYAARALARMWAAGGGVLQGKVVAPTRTLAPSALPTDEQGEPLEPLSFHRSMPLPEVLRAINKLSDNVGARNLMLSLSPGFPERPATLAGAQKVMQMWLRQQGLAEGDIVVENGSGLSHAERARPRAMAQLLRRGWHSEQAHVLVESLPIAGVDGTLANRLHGRAAGQAFLKTGTLNDTAALAGYVRGASGKMYAVALMVNDAEAARGRGVMDVVIEWLARNG